MKLQVWNHSNHVGTLSTNDNGRWCLSYDLTWHGFALSPHIPVGENANDIVHQRNVEWFFDNLLPEGPIREALAKREFIHKEDSWGMLARYGQDTAGALTILADGITPAVQQEYTPLSINSLAEMIDQSKAGVPLMTQGKRPHMSLAGAQEKIALHIDPVGNYFMPEGPTPSMYILKPENVNNDYPFCPVNEWFCMTLANMVGLNAPSVDIVSVESHRVYIVQRYDRKLENGFGVRRLHQIDLCQARNASPKFKYEDQAGLSAKDLFAVTANCLVPVIANNAAMSWMVFNYIIGNGDAHAKNISFLMMSKRPEVAPVYDLLCVDAYHRNYHLSMGIGGQLKAGWVEGCNWDALALENSLDPRAMRLILAKISVSVKKNMDAILSSEKLLPSEKEWLIDNVKPVIDERLSFVQEALSQQVCNAITIHNYKDVVPSEILDDITNLTSASKAIKNK